MGKSKILFLIFIGFSTIFLFSPKAHAAEAKVVFTEIMYNLSGSDEKHEWIEILNSGETSLKITDWRLNDGDDATNHRLNPIEGEDIWITPNEYLILASDRETFLSDHPGFEGEVVDTAMALNNSSSTITLYRGTDIIDQITYESSWGAGGNDRTLEKINPGEPTDENWQESYVFGGTPGQPSSQMTIPDYPAEIFSYLNINHTIIKTAKVTNAIDGDTIRVDGLGGFPNEIRLLGIDCPEKGQALAPSSTAFTDALLNKEVDLIISQQSGEQVDIYGRTLAVIIFSNEIFNIQLLQRGLAKYFVSDNSVLKSSAWMELAEQAQSEHIGIWASTGGRSIILSEIMPNPAGDDAIGEWIEIYNPLEREVNLSYFLIDQYEIPYGTVIAPKTWRVFYRTETGIVLDNNGDQIELFFPDGVLVDKANYSSAKEGESWALVKDIWQWTDQVTLNADNIGHTSLVRIDLNVPLNLVPVPIETGDVQNYENYLVKITAVVVETEGNTFYLDDGSGRIKVYIQASANIQKPTMHKNDIFQIVGIVDFYRNGFRILPRKTEDILLIKAAKSRTGLGVSSKVKNTVDAANLTKSIKSAAAAESPDSLPVRKTPIWIELVEALIAMSVVTLVLFLIRVFSIKKEKPIGYNFGNDDT